MQNKAKLILLFVMIGTLHYHASMAQEDSADEFDPNRPSSFGIVAGVNFNKLGLPVNYDGDIEESGWSASSTSFTVGLTYDKPIYVWDLSINASLLFSKASYATSSTNQNVDTDILINLTSLDGLISVRHTVGMNTWRPFFYAGGLFSYNLKDTGKIYKSMVDPGQITIELLTHRTLVSEFSIGYGFGAGVQRMLAKTRGVSLELRYFTAGHTKEFVNSNHLTVLAGFTF